MGYFYTLIETQVNSGVKAVAPPTVYDEENQALAAMYLALSYAALSTIEYHAVLLLRSDGTIIDGRVFDRRQVAGATEEEE